MDRELRTIIDVVLDHMPRFFDSKTRKMIYNELRNTGLCRRENPMATWEKHIIYRLLEMKLLSIKLRQHRTYLGQVFGEGNIPKITDIPCRRCGRLLYQERYEERGNICRNCDEEPIVDKYDERNFPLQITEEELKEEFPNRYVVMIDDRLYAASFHMDEIIRQMEQFDFMMREGKVFKFRRIKSNYD